ncbi:protein slit-like [Argiope bruennichi]|uniref:protein slit-like n=1 Tax=Argiope bruennichi TaxID=94029 RepID=UPI002493F798|nr:protein slit-like [Argiope bruennichi]
MAPVRNLSMSYSTFVIALLWPAASLAASIASSESCPVTNNHCTCLFKGPFYSIRCNSMSKMTDFKAVLSNVGENAAVLELDSMHLEFLPLNDLSNSSLHTLIVGNSSFQRIHNSSGLHQPVVNLHHLSLENVTFSEKVQWKQFSNLTNLQVLFVYNTSVQNVIPSNFSSYGSKSLVSLTVTESNITRIERNSLKLLTNLTALRISYNNLRTFRRDALPQTSKLEQLRLDSNRIHTLPAGVFSDLPHLKLVSLSNNTISTLPQDVFGPLWKPDVYIDLRGNPLKCDRRLLWTVTSETKPKRIIGKCVHPKQHFGKNIADLTEEELNC